jgi:hypothetical protein
MNLAELRKATKEFDHGPGPEAVPPTPTELAKHRRAMLPAKRRRGRPAFGDGAARVLFTIDPRLLIRLDAFARKHGMKRSRLIAESVESYMKFNSGGGSSETFRPSPLAAMAR